MKQLLLITLIFCQAGLVFSLFAAEEPEEWVVESLNANYQVEINLLTQEATADHGVLVRYGPTTLTAIKASVNERTGDVMAEGKVRIEREGAVWEGDRIHYNFRTRQLDATGFKAGHPPFFVRGEGLWTDFENQTYVATNALVTTDNVPDPAQQIRAKEVKIIPGKYIEAHGATLYLGKVPIFYFPYYHRSLERHPNNFELTPGYRSLFGPYLLTTYNWYWNDRLSGGLNMDYRYRKGVGFGPDFHYNLGQAGEGDLKTYYAPDQDPGLDLNNVPIRDDRYRINFTHVAHPRTNLTVMAALRYQSDAQIIRDFFEAEYRKDVQPNSFLEVNQNWPNWTLNLLVQPRVNEFFETVERLPDIKLSGLPQQLGVSPFYYQSESTLGYYRRRFPSGQTNDFSAWRGDTFQQITLPKTFFNWLNVTPRVGERLTHYGETDGYGTTMSAHNRAVFNTGAELSTKASRVWSGAKSDLFEIHGLRHIFEPSVNYVFVPSPNVDPNRLPQFDYELPSTRLLPIEYPDYNAIDSVDSQNVIRLSIRNKLQTKRGGLIDNVINWALYTDWRLHPRPDQQTYSDIYSDLDLKPRSWLSLNSQVRINPNSGDLREANHRLTIAPNTVWSVALGHRYLNDPAFGANSGNNLFSSTIYYRINENWGTRMSHYFEARDGTLEEQYYTVYRDFRSWTGALTLRIRENRTGGPTDFTIAFTFSLKAYPRFGLGEDSLHPASLVGG